MAIPGQSLTLRDPGLGLVEQSGNLLVFLGCAEKGSTSEVKSFSSPAAVVDEYGHGPLPEMLCHVLSVAGGPVYACRLSGTTAGTASSVTKSAAGSSTGEITLAGAPFDRYQAIVEIMATGTVGTATFRYSLDNGKTYSETINVPSGGDYEIDGTNLTVTFTPGAGAVFFEQGDTHTFTTAAPHYSTTEMATGVTNIRTYLSTSPGFAFDALILVGRNATGSGAATMFGALSTHMATLASAYSYMRALMDAGSGDTRANVKSAFASVADARIGIVYGDAVTASGKPFAGFGSPLMPALVTAAARAKGTPNGETVISTDLARVATGPLTGVTAISHDEFVTEEMDSAKVSTTRTFPMSAGYFLTNLRLKSPTGSDFLYWQHGRIMDVACRTVALAQIQFISAGFATNDDGTIAEFEAKRLEAIVNEKLTVALMDPKNAEGRQGHVSAFRYRVNRTNNVQASNTLMSSVAIRPLFYAKTIETELGFAVNV